MWQTHELPNTQFNQRRNETRIEMHLLRKALVPLAGVAVIALAMSVVGPRAVRALPISSFSPTAVRYPWAAVCVFSSVTFTSARPQSCVIFSTVPASAVFVIETITKDFNTELPVDSVNLYVSTLTGGNTTLWSEHTTAQEKSGGVANFYGSAQTTLYQDPGSSAQIQLTESGASAKSSINGAVYLIGYYVYPPAS